RLRRCSSLKRGRGATTCAPSGRRPRIWSSPSWRSCRRRCPISIRPTPRRSTATWRPGSFSGPANGWCCSTGTCSAMPTRRATPMNPALVSPTREDEQGILSAALRQVRGPAVSLEDWSAQPLAKHGKQRVVRYDLHARAAHGGELFSLQWVGKFYEDDGAARRVAAVLRELAASDCGARGEMEVPRVLAYDAPRRLLLLTYEGGESVVSAI